MGVKESSTESSTKQQWKWNFSETEKQKFKLRQIP